MRQGTTVSRLHTNVLVDVDQTLGLHGWRPGPLNPTSSPSRGLRLPPYPTSSRPDDVSRCALSHRLSYPMSGPYQVSENRFWNPLSTATSNDHARG